MNPWTYLDELLAQHRPQAGHVQRVAGCTAAARPLVAAVLAAPADRPGLVVLPDNHQAEQFTREMAWYLGRFAPGARPPVFFPALETDPYRGLSPHPAILEQRCLVLWRILEEGARLAVTSAAALMEKIPAPEAFINRLLEFRVSREMPLTDVRHRLDRLGYKLEDPVTEPGEFAIRGGVLDVYTPQLPYPLRVEFFGDYVDSLRLFDPASQRSQNSLDTATVIPVTPYPAGRDALAAVKELLDTQWAGSTGEPVREAREHVLAGACPPGGEFLLARAFPANGSLLQYFGPETVLQTMEVDLASWCRLRYEQLEADYSECNGRGQPCLPPAAHFFTPPESAAATRGLPALQVASLFENPEDVQNLPLLPTASFLGNFSGLIKHLASTREHILFVLSSRGRCERIHDLLNEYGIGHRWQEDFHWADLETNGPRQIVISGGPLDRGFRLPALSLAILGSEDIFPRVQKQRETRPAPRRRAITAFFSDFHDLRPGDVIVHVDHGVGLFRGLEKLSAGGVEQEFAHLEYAEQSKLYVPVERLDLVQKYSGAEGLLPPLDRLGGTSWQKTRTRVKKALRDMAGELIQIYARRSVAGGTALPADDHWMREFEDMFEYEETPDQLRAIQDIKQDLESPRPMDRLLCGDVGYGKTEVAMRAAFKAAGAGCQVAVLAPTTILAYQHFSTFSSRFASFPINIDLLSRFRNSKEQKETVRKLKEGQVDIIIGTHRLLSADVAFKNLGLLIVDEEQRFGVAHKEKIKKLKTGVDVLTMSATPIPRTLYMSIAGIRDVSVIETPPKDRLAIQTQVVHFSDEVVAEAIRKELARNGQVYFVHNRVETIHAQAARLKELVPEARLVAAHGQMDEKELEKIILDFMSYQYDVLLSTTIIENGIDIPLVNTMIINQAQKFGLAQLYQLRGRVGRSNRRAYAWLLVPSLDGLSDVARKRLAAIRDFTELGAGFRLAALDMEIRGAGNLLGAEQHGHINSIGFEMYCRLMEEAVKELKGETYVPPETIKINLHIRLQIPETYIPQEQQRLILYKRIASVESEEQLGLLREEIRDRYGVFPEVVEYLLDYTRLKLLAQEMHIQNIERRQDIFRIQLTPESRIDPERLVEKIQQGDTYSFSPDGMLTLRLPYSSIPGMFGQLKKALSDIGGHATIQGSSGPASSFRQ